MSALDALLGMVKNSGVEVELGGGLNFGTGLTATFNPSTGIIDVAASGGGGGAGDVVGPASAIDARVAVFSGVSGKLIADGGYTIAGILAAGGAYAPGAAGNVLVSNGTVFAAGALDLADSDARIGLLPDANLANLAGLSVSGRSANTSGVRAPITGTDGQALRVSGTVLGFGTIATAGIGDAQVTLAKLANGTALSVIGRAANTGGVYADVVATTVGQVLGYQGTALVWGTSIGDGTICLEVADLGSSREVVSINLGSALTTTQMPANTGDRVAYVANAQTEPTTGVPATGCEVWAASGALKYRGPNGGATAGGGIWELAPNAQYSRYHAKDDTGTTNSVSITTVGTIDTAPMPDNCAGVVKAWVYVQDGTNALAVQEIQAGFQINGGSLQAGGTGALLSGSVAQGPASFGYSVNNLLVRMTSSDSVAKTYKVYCEFTFAVNT